MKRFAQQFREFSRAAAYTNLVFSLFAVVAPVLLAPGMIFQPGWANGWPGLSKQSVFATVMTGFLFMMVVGVGSAASAILCAWLEKTVKRSFVAWAVFLLLEFGISVISAVVSWNVYPIIHASISADWK